jgi:hypothetical protein
LFSTSDYPFVSSNVSYQFMIFAYYFLWCCWFESRSGRGVQHYLIKFVNDLRRFLRVLRFPLSIKLTVTT